MSIRDKALLVSMSISTYTGRKQNRKVTSEVTEQHGAKENAGRFWTALVDPDMLSPVTKLASRIRTFHYDHTLPWSDTGPRLLASRGYQEYVQGINKLNSQFKAAADELCKDWNIKVANEALRLGDLYDPSLYPSASEVRSLYNVGLSFVPIPAANDLRVDASDAEIERLRKQVIDEQAESLKDAMRDAYERLKEHLVTVSDRLAPSNEGKQIYNNLLANVVGVCDKMRFLNIVDDPQLDQIADKVRREFGVFSADDLRQNRSPNDWRLNRHNLKQTADQAISLIDGYMAQ